MMSCGDSAIEQKGARAAVLADRAELLTPSREDLVGVGLVSHVPDDLVPRGFEHGMKRYRELARPEVRAEVPADLADCVDDVLAHLLRELGELLLGQAVQVLGIVLSARAGS